MCVSFFSRSLFYFLLKMTYEYCSTSPARCGECSMFVHTKSTVTQQRNSYIKQSMTVCSSMWLPVTGSTDLFFFFLFLLPNGFVFIHLTLCGLNLFCVRLVFFLLFSEIAFYRLSSVIKRNCKISSPEQRIV